MHEYGLETLLGLSILPSFPPPPPLVNDDLSESENEALCSMLMSWYMSGYHTGYYQVMSWYMSDYHTGYYQVHVG